MVYDWSNKEEILYRLYIEEKKSLEDIMEHMKENHQFTPSKRAFQTQFKRWEFPSKQNPAHKNVQLVDRVKELWEQNTSQKEMLRILNEVDGFEIKERELMRVRAKHRWLLRVPNGMKAKKRNTNQDVMEQLQQAIFEDDSQSLEDLDGSGNRTASPELSPEVIAKRQERLQKLQAESAQRYKDRKRRRRTRDWAGLPADPAGPPRFPSETTIDESKGFLNLDNDLYRDLRTRFQEICEDEGVIKKTIAGPEKWEAVKNRLVQEIPHLQSMFWGNDDNIEQKKLALDVVCMDVTKRMRTLERRMTIAEAKNSLGINPEESRQIRNAFYLILKADHFTSKLEAGDEHWQELKGQWIAGNDLLQKILAPGNTDPKHGVKVRAMEVLCRDVMKRLRDDQTKRDPTRKKKFDSAFSVDDPDALDFNEVQHTALDNYQLSTHGPSSHNQARHAHTAAHDQLQIDPSLLLAAANDPSILDHRNPFIDHPQPQYGNRQYNAQAIQGTFRSPSMPIAVYFRIHPASAIQPNSLLWVSTLSSVSFNELQHLATSKFPGTVVAHLEGVVKEQNGSEVALQIDQDDELHAYLTAIEGIKPVFNVQLMHGWKAS